MSAARNDPSHGPRAPDLTGRAWGLLVMVLACGMTAACSRVGVPENQPVPVAAEQPAADRTERERPGTQTVEPARDQARPAPVRVGDGRIPEPAPRVVPEMPAATIEDPAVTARTAWLNGPDEILESAYAGHQDIQERVEFWMEFWQTRGRGYFQRYLQRMALYLPVVERELMAQQLPPSLRFLPVIESGYNPTAVSRVGATGLWQFMSPTARWLGMRVDGFVDERRNPHRSTQEAVGYLVDLHDEFGSWFLALAAYNSGPGRVRGILRRNAPGAPAGDSLFWALSERFPTETSLFVPKLLAATALASDPIRYGFEAPNFADTLTFELVEVQDATSLDVVAEAAGADVEDVVALNPQLVQRVTPVGTLWTVRVPPGGRDGFADRLAEIPESDRVTFIQHRVASGETLGHIAEDYGIRVSQLRAANPGVSPRRLQIGQRLIIPRGPANASERRVARASASSGGGDERAVAQQASTTAVAERSEDAPASDGRTHVVRPGENPWSISRSYGVGLDNLLAWNGLSRRSVLKPGDRLQIRGGAVRLSVYRVQPGDTLSEIAERHGVSTRALMDHNRLTSRSVIRPGDQIQIPGS